MLTGWTSRRLSSASSLLTSSPERLAPHYSLSRFASQPRFCHVFLSRDFLTALHVLQVPPFGVPAKIIVIGMSFFGTAIAAVNYFKIIFIEGGVGRSRSTVAVKSI